MYMCVRVCMDISCYAFVYCIIHVRVVEYVFMMCVYVCTYTFVTCLCIVYLYVWPLMYWCLYAYVLCCVLRCFVIVQLCIATRSPKSRPSSDKGKWRCDLTKGSTRKPRFIGNAYLRRTTSEMLKECKKHGGTLRIVAGSPVEDFSADFRGWAN